MIRGGSLIMKINSDTKKEKVKEQMKSAFENMCFIQSSSKKSTLDDAIRKTIGLSQTSFSEYDFIRLFVAELLENGIVKIDISKLGYELIEFYRKQEYSELFDMPVKKQIEGDFVDISSCIQQAILGGILSSHTIQNTDERLIILSDDDKKEIINSYDEQYISKMKSMVSEYIVNKSLKDNSLENSEVKQLRLQRKLYKSNKTN